MIYQATLRRELHQSMGFEWAPVDPHRDGRARRGGPRHDHRLVAALQPAARVGRAPPRPSSTGQLSAAQLAAAQKATRPAKPEELAWAELQEQWRADGRGLRLDRAALRGGARGAARGRAHPVRPGAPGGRGGAHRKAAFTRADLIEIVGAQLPVDSERVPARRWSRPRSTSRDAVDRTAGRASTRRPRTVHPGPHPRRRRCACSIWSTRAMTAPSCWVQDGDTARLSRRSEARGATTSAAHPGWCSRCPRRRARARPPRCAPCARPCTAAYGQRAGAGADRQGRRRRHARRRRRRRLHHRQSPALAAATTAWRLNAVHAGRGRRGRHGRHRRPAPTAHRHHPGRGQDRAGRRRPSTGAGEGPRRHVRPTVHRPALDPTPLRGVAHARPRRAHRLARAARRRPSTGPRAPSTGTAPTTGCTAGTPSPWPPTPWPPTAPTPQPARTRCWSATPPRWPTRSTNASTTNASTADAPTVTGARGQRIGVGDLILTRRNDPTIDLHDPSTPDVDQRGLGAQRQPLARRRHQPRHRIVSPPNASTTAPASSSRTTTCASTSASATRSPCTPPKASPPTPATPCSARTPAAPCSTSR